MMDLQDAAILLGSVALAVGLGLLIGSLTDSAPAGIGAGIATCGAAALLFGFVGIPAIRRGKQGEGE